jgi:cytochrome c-type biogenesis protein CcmH
MIGWIWFIAFAVLLMLGLWKIAKVERQTLELTGAAIFLAMAGYAWQGQPGKASAPVATPESATADADAAISEIKRQRPGLTQENQWLDLADALIRVGNTRAAVSILREGTSKSPNNPDIWVGLGAALVEHNQGQLSPAAQYAFEKAANIAPNHPGPPFFLGLSLARGGKFDEAGDVWRGLLARSPDGPMKDDLVKRLTDIGQMPAAPGEKPTS